ncbi:MAG: hypothetical protein EOM26_11135 [Alphaproteobacteria bacterium]|nr:hypothetical protein [Alphaproteobacteria bacterium]
MRYFFSSLLTFSFWGYALFSWQAVRGMLAVFGAIFLIIQALDFFGIYQSEKYDPRWFWGFLTLAIGGSIIPRLPVAKVSYKVPKKDLCFDVVVGNILESRCLGIVISTNTTFDTDIASGIIAQDSLQGQLTTKYFRGNTAELDRQIEEALADVPHEDVNKAYGKAKAYPMGTVAKVTTSGKDFYLVAMAELNKNKTAQSSVQNIESSLEKLWAYVANNAEFTDIAIPILGTARGRIKLPRKKMIEKIAQSFADASADRIFSNRLVIYVRPEDAAKYNVNLFEIKDYLRQSLHV